MTKPITKVSTKKINSVRSSRLISNICFGLTAIAIGGSCSVSPETALENSNYKTWKQLAAESARINPPAPSFTKLRDFHQNTLEDKETSLKATVSKPEPLPTISISNMVLTREMDVGVLLRTLADAADLNVIISSNVSGPVHVSLRNETRWDRLFLAITEARGYSYDLQDDLLSVFSAQDIRTKIALDEALNEQRLVAEEKLRSEPMSIDMIRIHYADIENLANSVRTTMMAVVAATDSDGNPTTQLGQGAEHFTIQADKDTGQLILHGIPTALAQARKLIEGLDQPTYQIMIEASIVQATNEVARQLGVQWGVFNGGNSTLGSVGEDADGNLLDGFNSNFPASFDAAGSGFVFGASRVRGSNVLQAQLSALATDGRLNIVSRPSITTLDQLTAVIESGEERPFSSAAGTGAGAISQVEFKEAVLRLEVTPHVIDSNWVKLNISSTNDEFDDTQAIVIDGNIQVPILTRSAMTSLYLANGQTTVIGGLSSETSTELEDGIPYLKGIPGIGPLFRNSSKSDSFDDTLIFITPHILPRGGSSVDYSGK